VTTTTTASPDLSAEDVQLTATRGRLEAECAQIAELRRELQGCEKGVRRLTTEAYWEFARRWARDAAQH
jgi:hypothetical protein